MLRSKLTFANVTSFLALFVALSASSYAAITLPANSVGTKQIKKGAVTNAKLARNAVNGSKVVPGSLTGVDLARNAVTGSKVVPGSLTGADINLTTLGKVPSAAAADTAAAAAIAKVQIVNATGTNAAGPSVAAATASCPQGTFVLGGGTHLADQTTQLTNDSYPSANNTWTGDVFNTGTGTPSFTVYAICGPAAATG